MKSAFNLILSLLTIIQTSWLGFCLYTVVLASLSIVLARFWFAHNGKAESKSAEPFDPKDNSVLEFASSRNSSKRQKFLEILQRIKHDVGERGTSVFISRAWASHEHDHPYDKLADILATDLKAAGIDVIIDNQKLGVGNDMFVFMKLIAKAQYVIVVYNPVYKKKVSHTDPHIRRELNSILQLLRFDTEFFIPVLMAGEEENSVPKELRAYLYENLKGERYYKGFFDILEQKLLKHLTGPVLKGEAVDLNKYKREFFLHHQASFPPSTPDSSLNRNEEFQTSELRTNSSPAYVSEYFPSTADSVSDRSLTKQHVISSLLGNNISSQGDIKIEINYQNQKEIENKDAVQEEPYDVKDFISDLQTRYKRYKFNRLFTDSTLHLPLEVYYQTLLLKVPSQVDTAEDDRPEKYRWASTKRIDETDLFNPNVLIINNQQIEVNHILMEGEAGIGKSTWCKHIAKEWSLRNQLSEFDVVLHVALRDLVHEVENKKKERNEEPDEIDAWCVALGRPVGSKIDKDVQKLKKIQRELEGRMSTKKILYLLDGFDEISHVKLSLIAKLLEKPYVILTTRFMEKSFHRERFICIMGFQKQEKEQFISDYYKQQSEYESLLTREKANQLKVKLLEKLASDDALQELSASPTILEMLCWLFQRKANDKLFNAFPLQLTQLYHACVDEFTKNWLARTQRKEEIATGRLLSEAPVVILLDLLSEIACQTWQDPKHPVIVSYEKFRKIYDSRSKEEKDLVNEADLLIHFGLTIFLTHDVNFIDRDWMFIHRTFQEFFTARFLVNEVLKLLDSAERESCVSVVLSKNLGTGYVDTLISPQNQVLLFFFGLLSKENQMTFSELLTLFIPCSVVSENDKQFYNFIGAKLKKYVRCLAEMDPDNLQNYDPNLIPQIFHLEIWFCICRCAYRHLAIWFLGKVNNFSVNQTSRFGYIGLHFACESKRLDFVQYLVGCGSNINHNEGGATPLHHAARFGTPEIVEFLCSKGAKVNSFASNEEGHTPIILAMSRFNYDIARNLIKSGAELDKPNYLGESFYLFVKLQEKFSEFNLTERAVNEKLAEIDEKAKHLPDKDKLMIAACQGKEQELIQIVENNPSFANLCIGNNNVSVLHQACWRGYLGIIQYLVRKGAKIQARIWNGRTPLHYAIQRNHLHVIQFLVGECPDALDDKDDFGQDSMHFASESSSYEIFKFIKDQVHARKKDY